ncbi:hypothetical protein CVO96_00805 [Deinococcus koreensis]|uniref:Choice-of-anchor D domain-containing protein n=2 Tax=Deinococcus koreensis TaxID=2054903 RepID=A0A2K3UU73_9DEIO|nr:hypothetical protein CVO96_00805 [Deinococcus koreensis]
MTPKLVRVSLQASATALLSLSLMACAESGQATAPTPPGDVVTLGAQPGTVVLSGVQNEESAPQRVTLTNPGSAPVQIDSLSFGGASPEAFRLASVPSLPLTLAAGQSVDVQVRLAARAVTSVTGDVLRATLQARGTGISGEVPISALRAAGLEGNFEPSLAQIVDTLGYRLNVGTNALILGTDAMPRGEEVSAPLFRQAGAGKVTLRPVARYSPDGPSPFGLFTMSGSAPQLKALGTLATGTYQTLNPRLVEGVSSVSFESTQKFGIYLAANSYAPQNTYSLDAVNTGSTRHAVRVYPLRDAAGQPVANSYLLGFEPSRNGDYQDVVFILENVVPTTYP